VRPARELATAKVGDLDEHRRSVSVRCGSLRVRIGAAFPYWRRREESHWEAMRNSGLVLRTRRECVDKVLWQAHLPRARQGGLGFNYRPGMKQS
jgi:hypothetical protein